MNDWWNDPPEEIEIPECCGWPMEETEDALTCKKCGQRIAYQDDDPGPNDFDGPDQDIFVEYIPHLCPHQNEWGDCPACDHEADIAFDAARERRIFGR